MSGLTIGELAREAGVGVETVRFYERRGLISDPPRTPSGYRAYPREAVRRLRFIRRAKELGFSLREIQELLDIRVGPEAACGEVRDQIAGKLVDLREKITDLRRMKNALEELRALCETIDPSSDCPILDLLEARSNG